MDFNKTYKKHFPDVYYLAMHFMKCKPDAEDITQEVFVRYWRVMSKVPVEKTRAFLMITTRNLCMNTLYRNNHFQLYDGYFDTGGERVWKRHLSGRILLKS